MCRMCYLATSEPVREIETAMKDHWGDANDDGVGVVWRDSKNSWISRFERTSNLTKVETPYDRLLIHFRKSTGGIGTHPFQCKDHKERGSDNWYLAHNGIVSNYTTLRDGGKYGHHSLRTAIDSEVLVHIWGSIDPTGKSLEDMAREYAKICSKDVKGMVNVLLYNVTTDEFIACSDGSLKMVYKPNKCLAISSDTQWIDDDVAKKWGVKIEEIAEGDVVIGTGLKWKKLKNSGKLWNVNNVVYSCNSDDTEIWTRVDGVWIPETEDSSSSDDEVKESESELNARISKLEKKIRKANKKLRRAVETSSGAEKAIRAAIEKLQSELDEFKVKREGAKKEGQVSEKKEEQDAPLAPDQPNKGEPKKDTRVVKQALEVKIPLISGISILNPQAWNCRCSAFTNSICIEHWAKGYRFGKDRQMYLIAKPIPSLIPKSGLASNNYSGNWGTSRETQGVSELMGGDQYQGQGVFD